MGDRIIANENMLNYFKGFFLCSPMHEITMSETHTGSAGSRGIGGLDGLPGTKGFPGSPGTHGPCDYSGTGARGGLGGPSRMPGVVGGVQRAGLLCEDCLIIPEALWT